MTDSQLYGDLYKNIQDCNLLGKNEKSFIKIRSTTLNRKKNVKVYRIILFYFSMQQFLKAFSTFLEPLKPFKFTI